jgi:hypothetical protein
MPYQTYIPKYGHHKASGQAVVRLDGRYFYLGPYGSAASRQEYDRLVAHWQIAGRCLPEAGPKSVAQIMLASGRYLHQYYHCPLKGFHKDIHAWKMAVRPLKARYAHMRALGTLTRNRCVIRLKDKPNPGHSQQDRGIR